MYFNPGILLQRSFVRYQLDSALLEHVDEATRKAEQDEFTIIHVSTKVQEMIANDLAQRMIKVEKKLASLSQETVRLKYESDLASKHLQKTVSRNARKNRDSGISDDGDELPEYDESSDLSLDDSREMELDLHWLERLQRNIKDLYDKKELVLQEKLQIKQQYCELLEKQTHLRTRIEGLQRRLDERRSANKVP
jgi:hypothetical protein